MLIDLSCPAEIFRAELPTEEIPAASLLMFNLSDRIIASAEVTLRLLSAAGEETATPAKPDTAAVTDGAHEGTDPDESGKRSLLPWILPIALIAAFAVGGAAAFLLVRKKAGKN